MIKLLTTFGAIAGLAFVLGCNRSSDNTGGTSTSQSSDAGAAAGESTSTQQRAPDNTGINARDRSDAALTPMDQGGTDAERQLTANIRKALTQDQFSTDAKNIKIITAQGKVTLRGPVKDAQERQAVESAVKAVSGVTSVDNQLEPKTQTNQ